MMSLVHDLAEADVGDITPEHASGISREKKLELEQVSSSVYYPCSCLPSVKVT